MYLEVCDTQGRRGRRGRKAKRLKAEPSVFPRANVGFSALRAKIPENRLFLTTPFSSVFQTNFSFLGYSLSGVVVFNAKRAA